MTRALGVAAMIVATAALLLAALAAAPAGAATKIATYQSKDCGSKAVTWRIGYRFYWKDSEGRTIERETNLGKLFTNYALDQAKAFAERVAEYSHCGVRVQMDIWDMEGAVWQAHDGNPFVGGPDSGYVLKGAPDANAFRAQNDYDMAFYRVPQTGRENYSGKTQGADVEMPMQKDVEYGPQTGLLFHEWLHGVEFFYTGKIAQGFPRGGVHGACNYRQYFQNCGYADEQYFAAMMRGEVPEGGGRFSGIKVEEWKKFGRPRAPVGLAGGDEEPYVGGVPPEEPRFEPTLTLEQVGRRVVGNSGVAGGAEFTLVDATSGRVAIRRSVTGSFEIEVPGGDYVACLYYGGDSYFSPSQVCERIEVARLLNELIELKERKKFGRALLSARGPARGARAELVWKFLKCTESEEPPPPIPLPRRAERRAVTCSSREVVRRVELGRERKLRAPKPRKSEKELLLDVAVPTFESGGKLYETEPGIGAYWSR